jgi:hypothetical protein
MTRLFAHPWRLTFAAVAVALAALVLANCFDQELTQEARALYSRPGVAFSPDSGWALLMGFNAPVGEDPRAYAEAQRRSRAARPLASRRGAVAPELDIRAASELLCVPQDADCIRAFAQRPESIGELASDNAVMLARYDQLLGSKGLSDTAEALDYYTEIAYFNHVLRTQVVRLSQIGAAAGTGRVDQALAWLEADAAFHRRWLVEAGSILTKMLAVRTFSRDLLLVGQIARAGRELSPAQWEALERIAAPLTQSQRGVAPVFRAEAYYFSQVLDNMLANPRATSEVIDSPRLMAGILAVTVKRNATLNFAQPLFAEWMALDAVPTDALAPAIEQVQARIRRAGEPDWTWAYNYTGKSLAGESPPDLGEYVYRVRDLEALGALVRCVIALRRPGTSAESAGAFVDRSEACRDPHGGPFGWDAKSGELSFKARARGQAKRFGGRDDRVIFAAYPR